MSLPDGRGNFTEQVAGKKLNIEVDSAGTGNYHVGEHPDDRAIATAKKFGVDISKLIARQFSKSDFERFDRIYAMDSSNYKDIVRMAGSDEERNKVHYFYSVNNKGLDVPDPWYGGMVGFVEVFKLLDRNCDLVIDELSKNLSKHNNASI